MDLTTRRFHDLERQKSDFSRKIASRSYLKEAGNLRINGAHGFMETGPRSRSREDAVGSVR